jgi:hypothetical protein
MGRYRVKAAFGIFNHKEHQEHKEMQNSSDFFVLLVFFVIKDVECYGGSKPPWQNGLQRQIRQAPLQAPRRGPCFRTAPMKYSLQLGSKRHTAGSTGRITS